LKIEPDAGAGATQATRAIRAPQTCYLWLDFLAPLLLLCDLPARVFVDFFTMRFFEEVFFAFEAVVRFATISIVSFGCHIGRLRSQGYFTSAPQKREAARLQIRRSSGFRRPCCNLRSLAALVSSIWTCVTSDGRTYSGIKKTGQAKSFTGNRFAIRDSALKPTSTCNIPARGIELAVALWTFARQKPKFEDRRRRKAESFSWLACPYILLCPDICLAVSSEQPVSIP
jgi:hypothetical protein